MISEQAYALCMAIEELPASEMQTQISVMAAELRAKVAGVEEENVRLRPRAEIAGSLLTRTSKAEKRCRELEEELTLCLKEAPVGILAAICDMNKILGLEMPKTSYTEIPPAIQAVVARAEAAEARIADLEAQLSGVGVRQYREAVERLHKAEARVRELEKALEEILRGVNADPRSVVIARAALASVEVVL